ADPMVSAAERAGFEKEMKAIKANYRSINYPNATHAFTNPAATAVGKKYKLPIAYNKKASDQAFAEMLKFLKQ
ncbi:MAG: dienelactone hydrolase family protein, partial [Bacteriovoracia bacterium]